MYCSVLNICFTHSTLLRQNVRPIQVFIVKTVYVCYGSTFTLHLKLLFLLDSLKITFNQLYIVIIIFYILIFLFMQCFQSDLKSLVNVKCKVEQFDCHQLQCLSRFSRLKFKVSSILPAFRSPLVITFSVHPSINPSVCQSVCLSKLSM